MRQIYGSDAAQSMANAETIGKERSAVLAVPDDEARGSASESTGPVRRAKREKPHSPFRRRESKYVPTYDLTRGEWSMSQEEMRRIFDQAHPFAERGDWETYLAIIRKIPVTPNAALMARDDYGKEGLLALGWNLADAEIAYGKDWLDNYKVDDGEC